MMELATLGLREKAAQLVFPRLGSNMPPPVTVAEDLQRFQEHVLDQYPVGGIVLFNGDASETVKVLSELQRDRAIPLLVGTDMERGVGQQIRGATTFPHAMAFSEAGPTFVRRAAAAQAREALACGIHITFAPCADVNRDPRNPIIATRAFSTDPERAAELVEAYIAGCRAEGLLTAAKHFPGHGNTHQDSHDEVPVVHADREELLAADLVPFVAAIESGVDLVMTAHVLYPALDPDRPATLSARILRGLLRDELGFGGAIITDSLLMGAVRAGAEEAGRQATTLIEAGVDILLDSPHPVRAVDGIVEAVESGTLEERLVNEAVERVLALKRRIARRFGSSVFADPSRAISSTEIGKPENATLAHEVAGAGIKTLDSRRDLLPLPRTAGEQLIGILIKPHQARFYPGEEPFGAEFRKLFPGSVFRQIGPEADKEAFDELEALARRAEYIVVAMVVKPAAWHSFGLRPVQAEFVRATVEQHTVVLVSLGSPFVLDEYPAAGARLCAFSDVEASQLAVVRRLAGAPS